jgi:hypothetical protein
MWYGKEGCGMLDMVFSVCRWECVSYNGLVCKFLLEITLNTESVHLTQAHQSQEQLQFHEP